jgi:hypothetical protein
MSAIKTLTARNLFLLLFMLSGLTCTKDRSGCYECLVIATQPDVYKNEGCFDNDEWESHRYVDGAGNAYADKTAYCRKRRQ